MTNEQNVSTILTESRSWLQKHERLLIFVGILAFAFFLTEKGLSIVSTYEGHKATQAAAVTAAQAAKNQEALTQAQSLLQSYQQQLATFAAANQELTAAIASRNTQLSTQQKTDSTLPPSSLADRWDTLINDKGVTAGVNGYIVNDTAAVSTVVQLETVPVLTQDLQDEKTKESNLQSNVNDANALIAKGKDVISGLQLQLTDQTKQCNVEIAAVKAEARKSKLKWFGAGVIVGFIGGLFK